MAPRAPAAARHTASQIAEAAFSFDQTLMSNAIWHLHTLSVYTAVTLHTPRLYTELYI